MRKLTNYLLIAVVAISTIAFIGNKKAASDFDIEKAEFINYLEEAKSYTMELAEAMPADKYTFKPHDSVRSFGEQLAHMGMSSKFLTDIFIKGEPMPAPEMFAKIAQMEKEMGADKEKCIATISESFKYVKDTYNAMSKEQLNETFKVPFDPETT